MSCRLQLARGCGGRAGETHTGMRMDGIDNQRFVEQFEQLFREIESIVQEYPPELREALRDEARVALRLQLQERWEASQRSASDRLN